MIVTDRFVFIHMHKTGGQTLNDAIERNIADHRFIGYHYPRAEIPVEFEHLPVVGIVRNPWDWYVSWYAFNKRPKIHNQIFNVVSDGGQNNFKATITNLINLGSDNSASNTCRNDLVDLLPETLENNRSAGLVKDDIRSFRDNNTGYYSWLFARMFGPANSAGTRIGKFENLQEDFLDIMERLSVSEADALRQALDTRARKNVSRHSHYSHYYDDELRDLVAEKESSLVSMFNYEFASRKPSGVAYEFPNDAYTGGNQGFQKLLGREKNYLQIDNGFDVTALRDKIEQIPTAKWLDSEREKLFAVHKNTHSVLAVVFEDFKHEKPEFLESYFDIEKELQPAVDRIADYYQNNGFIVRVLLAKLLSGGKIPHHTDAGYSLLNCHRVHIPVITSENVVFSVGGEEKYMHPGEFWEINNGVDHAVENRSNEDRIHIIIDWMPNFAGLPVEDVLRSPDANGTAIAGKPPEETVNAMIAKAYQVHQSGHAARAESLYRQVLHLDANNVVANNLFGLLCIQTKRSVEAAHHIGKALAESPDDAQAHANLGIALKDLNRPEEAAQHFHESLKLAPTNAAVYNNLGAVYVMLNRIDDALHCYRQALEIRPEFAEVLFNFGNALMQKQQYPEAVEALKKCLLLNPDFVEGQTKLVQALQGLENKRVEGH